MSEEDVSDSMSSRAARKAIFSCYPPDHHQTFFRARLGQLQFDRPNGEHITLNTPAMLTLTSRGVVPHLTRDHLQLTESVKWVHIPFESFLERTPPVLLDSPVFATEEQSEPNPLHTFLGFNPSHNVVSLALRDPLDGRELPPNGNKYVNACCVRGVRQVSPEQYRSYVHQCKPDLVIALSDVPFTLPPFSQKRITKSLERSTSWLANLLQSSPLQSLNILLPMAGCTSLPARQAFAFSLLETLHGKEAEQVKPLKTLDEGVFGYVFDLAGLRAEMQTSRPSAPDEEQNGAKKEKEKTKSPRAFRSLSSTSSYPLLHSQKETQRFTDLLRASLSPLPAQSHSKPRIVTGAASPHEILQLIRDVGIDAFDVSWAQQAADWGISLDFAFPVLPHEVLSQPKSESNVSPPFKRPDAEKMDIGHNLYSSKYASDFSRLSEAFQDGASSQAAEHALASTDDHSADCEKKVCPCIACSPLDAPLDKPIVHSSVDVLFADPIHDVDKEDIHSPPVSTMPYTRAYVHHLLHTHEMGAHAFLAAHNLAVANHFFDGIRDVLSLSQSRSQVSHHPHERYHHHHHHHQHQQHTPSNHENTSLDVTDDAQARFSLEVDRFFATYDSTLAFFGEAQKDWADVELARGKGRLARERAKLEEETTATQEKGSLGEAGKLKVELEEMEIEPEGGKAEAFSTSTGSQ